MSYKLDENIVFELVKYFKWSEELARDMYKELNKPFFYNGVEVYPLAIVCNGLEQAYDKGYTNGKRDTQRKLKERLCGAMEAAIYE
jgi:hypothetical protein